MGLYVVIFSAMFGWIVWEQYRIKLRLIALEHEELKRKHGIE